MSIAQSRLVRKFDVLKYVKFEKFEIEWVIVQICKFEIQIPPYNW